MYALVTLLLLTSVVVGLPLAAPGASLDIAAHNVSSSSEELDEFISVNGTTSAEIEPNDDSHVAKAVENLRNYIQSIPEEKRVLFAMQFHALFNEVLSSVDVAEKTKKFLNDLVDFAKLMLSKIMETPQPTVAELRGLVAQFIRTHKAVLHDEVIQADSKKILAFLQNETFLQTAHDFFSKQHVGNEMIQLTN